MPWPTGSARCIANKSDWTAISRLIPDEMVSAFCLAGTPHEVRSAWASLEGEYAERGATEVVFQTVGAGAPGEENIRNLRSIVHVLGASANRSAGTRPAKGTD